MSGEKCVFLWGDFGKFDSGESENFSLRGCTILSGDDWRSTLEFMSGESKSLLSVSILLDFHIKKQYLNVCEFLEYSVSLYTPRKSVIRFI